MNKETQKLFQVNLSITFQHVEDPFEAYESLRKALIKEYGTPLKERSIVKDGSHNKALLWIFPSTSILCSAWGKNLDNFMVQYFKNVGKTPDQFGFREAKTDTTKKVENKK
jgi:hypothetical protein